MKTLKLENGLEVKLDVVHEWSDRVVQVSPDSREKQLASTRLMAVVATFPANGVFIRTESVCVPFDNFSRSYGRHLAARKLVKNKTIVGMTTKKDRQAIIAAICPEFFYKKPDPYLSALEFINLRGLRKAFDSFMTTKLQEAGFSPKPKDKECEAHD